MMPCLLPRARRTPRRAILLIATAAFVGMATPRAAAQRFRGAPATDQPPPAATTVPRPLPQPAASAPANGNSVIGLAVVERAATNSQPACLQVMRVQPGSPAAENDVRPGDLVTHVNDQPIASAESFRAIVNETSGTLRVVFVRGRTKRMVTFIGGATRQEIMQRRQRLVAGSGAGAPPAGAVAAGEPVDPWTVPGLGERPASRTGINVLRRVFLDPRTGQLAFVGFHDPAYATGPIDYTTLLHDALRSPYPSFSLEPTPATDAAMRNVMQQVDQQMAVNLSSVEAGKAWMLRIFDLVLTDPWLEADRRRFLQRGAKLFNAAPDEVPALIQAMLGRTEMGSPPWVNFWVKLYEKAGAPEIGAYMRAAANKDADPYAFQASFAPLGLDGTIADLRERIGRGEITQGQGESLLQIEYWECVFRRVNVPESRWRAAAQRARARCDIDLLMPTVDAVNTDFVREHAMDPLLDGLMLSETFLQRMHQMPALEVAPKYLDGLAPDSELARTFLAADWTLKTLGVTPELADRVPGHVTPNQFEFQLETARHEYDIGNVRGRMWLAPEQVEIAYDPAGTVLNFGAARTSVRAEVMSHTGGSRGGDALIREAMSGYAAQVTQRYEDYARALPELHRLREAQKILALVRWAQARRQKLVPPGPAAPAQSLPANFARGFWTANFYSNAEKTFFGLSTYGGVDFGASAGDAWVQPQEKPELARTALGQLVGSAALGRQAAAAALAGDLEGARALADQSARAMTGDFDPSAHPELAALPDFVPPEPVLQAELQGELTTQTRAAIDDLARAGSGAARSQAEERLEQLKGLLERGTPAPADARQWVTALRNGDWGALPAAGTTPAPLVATTPTPPAVQPKPVVAPVAPAAPAPAAPVAAAPVVSAEERAKIRSEITALRSELCRIQSQLRRFNATIQADQQQRAEWERVTNEAYQSALDRAKEKLADFSVDFPDDKLSEKLESITDPAERAKVERALRMVQHLKEAYKVKDFSTWAAHEEYTRAEILEGVGIIVDILGVEDRIKEYLKKRWGLGRVLAFQEAAADLVTSAYDVTAEVVAWRRLDQLNRNSDAFLQATESSAERMRAVIDAIHTREVRLGLDLGASKLPCP